MQIQEIKPEVFVELQRRVDNYIKEDADQILSDVIDNGKNIVNRRVILFNKSVATILDQDFIVETGERLSVRQSVAAFHEIYKLAEHMTKLQVRTYGTYGLILAE